MEGQCDCNNLQREGGHPGLWELQRHQDEISYFDELGKIYRQKTEGGDKHKRTAVRFHAGQRREITDAIFAARQVMEKHREMQKELHNVMVLSTLRRHITGCHGRKFGGV